MLLVCETFFSWKSTSVKGHQFSVFYSRRQYCARRIRRIRKSLHFIQGTRYKVQPKKITQEMILKDARYNFFCLKSNQVAVMACPRLPTTFRNGLNDVWKSLHSLISALTM